jgi:hypothetical protein
MGKMSWRNDNSEEGLFLAYLCPGASPLIKGSFSPKLYLGEGKFYLTNP